MVILRNIRFRKELKVDIILSDRKDKKMKKVKKFIALFLTATFLFNSANYEVIAEEVSEQIQKYKVMQTQNTEIQMESTQEEIQTGEKEESETETEIINSVEDSEKVAESTEVTEATVTETERTSPIKTQIEQIKNGVGETTANPVSTEDITFEIISDKGLDIISNEEYSKNTKIGGGLTVKPSGKLDIKQGTVLEINGDLNIESGSLVNASEEGIKVIVRGNLIVEGRLHISNSSIMVEGNIIEKGESEIQGGGALVLIGENQQIIDTKSRISRLINENTSDFPLVFINSLNFELYEDNGKGIINYKKDGEDGYTTQEGPIIIEKRTNFFVRENKEQAIVNKELIIHGDLYIKGNVDVNIAEYDNDIVTLRVKGDYIQENGHFKTYNQNMTIEGDFVHKGGTFEVMGSDTKVTVLGNMTIQDNAKFVMTYPDSHVIVNGDFTIRNGNSNEFLNGVLEIKGDFLQEENENNFKLIKEDYEIEKERLTGVNNHKVILNGEGKQTITFKTPTLINADKSLKERKSQFATLEITKPFYSYTITNDLSKERIYENLIEPYDYDSSFYKNNDKPYRIRKNLDIAKSHLELVNSNGYIYAIGGIDQKNIISNDISRYNFEENTWTNIGQLAEKRMDFAAAAVNNDIYVFGGYNGTKLLNKVEVISSNGGTKTIRLNQESNIIERRAHEAVYYNGKIYIIGGEDVNGESLNTLEVYDLDTKTIETKASMNVGRKNFGASLYLIDNKFYIAVAGGENNNEILNSVEMYDIENDKWETKSNLLTARKGLGLQFIMGKLFVVGGVSTEGSDNSIYLNTVEGFDGKEWVELKDDTNELVCTYEKRGYFGSTVAYNSIFIAGGETPSKSDTFEQFMPINIPGVRFKGNTKGLNGDFTQEETDLVFNDPLTQFSLERVYNSQFKDEESDFLGYGWKFNFESSLKKMSSRIGTVNALYLNVRDNPWGRILGGVEKGTVLDITGETIDAYGKKWYQISEKYYVASWYIDEVKNEAIEVSYPNGTKGYFIDNEGNGEYTANFGTYEKIKFSSDENSCEIITNEQTKYVYSKDSNGKYRNTAIVDRYGNEISINYTLLFSRLSAEVSVTLNEV